MLGESWPDSECGRILGTKKLLHSDDFCGIAVPCLKKRQIGERYMVVQTSIGDWATSKEKIVVKTPQKELVELSGEVIGKMQKISQLQDLPLSELHKIPLGRLRRDAVRLHAVCRYNKGVNKQSNYLTPTDVRCVDLHPDSMSEQWRKYAAFLLYHEYLHALGFTGHDRTFRALEKLWPDVDGQTMGKAFGEHLRKNSASWLWQCTDCGCSHARSKRSNGRYSCRTCKTALIDVSNQPQL